MSAARHPGVRDGVSIVVVVVLAVGIWWAVSAAATFLSGPGYSISSHVFRAVATAALVIGMLLVVTRILRGMGSPPSGLRPDRRALPAAGIGAVGYLLPFAIASLVVLALGAAAFEVTGTALEAVGQVAAVLVLVLLYEAIPEELIFRGFLFSTVRRHVPAWAAVLIQAGLFCAFGVLIGAATTPDRIVLFALFSLALGVVRASTGSVFAAMGFHAAFQTVTQPVLGSQWTALTLNDPDRWYADIAYGLVPLVLGPLLVVALVRLRVTSAPVPA